VTVTYVEFEDDADTVCQERSDNGESDDHARDHDVTNQSRRLFEREHGVLNHLHTHTHTRARARTHTPTAYCTTSLAHCDNDDDNLYIIIGL